MKSMTETIDISAAHPLEAKDAEPIELEVKSEAKSTSLRSLLKKARGSLLFVIGFLLSPLSWWNDLVFNLPIAYGIGYVLSRPNPSLLVPCTIAGYWISNVLGFVLMQAGVVDVFQNPDQERNPKKEILSGLATSTAYTLLIVLLLQFKIVDVPALLSDLESIDVGSLWQKLVLHS